MESLEKHEKILALSQMLDQWAEENLGDDPNWKPLEAALPAEWCGGFMWMNRVVDKGEVIELYKHGITRRYLNLGPGGYAYQWTGSGYDPITLEEAIDHVFDGLEEMGWDRTTIYDDEFKAEKNRALHEAGWTVITTGRVSSPSPAPDEPAGEAINQVGPFRPQVGGVRPGPGPDAHPGRGRRTTRQTSPGSPR